MKLEEAARRFALEQLGEGLRDLAQRTTETAKAYSAASASPSSG